MALNEIQAREEILTMFHTAWTAQAGVLVGGNPPKILWQGKEEITPPLTDLGYARVTVLHNRSQQSSLAGEVGSIRWTRSGLVIIQCFGPINTGRGLDTSLALAKIAKDAFEGKSSPGGIWFRRCGINEIGPSNGWFQVNASAEFTYDEVK
jgi:hypothetical protein